MFERLQWIRLQPEKWLHWGAVRGGIAAHAQLTRHYPKSASFVLEAQSNRARVAMKSIAKKWWQPASYGAGATRIEAPPPGTMDMLWANMALHESPAPQALIADWHRALRVGGFVMFSCLGPDTARELRALYAHLGWPPAGHDLTDMHDWGDMLIQASFAEPVMDMERITLTFATPARLLAELSELGRNFHPARFAGLRGRHWKYQLEQAIGEQLATGPQGELRLTFEIIYGHAMKAAPRMKVGPVSAVSVDDMRSMLHGKGPAPTLR